MKAAAGQKYMLGKDEVIALEYSDYPRVIKIQADPSGYIWTSIPFNVDAKDLAPLPMRYHGGEVPA